MNNKRPILFFDGGCPLCSREISHYQRIDREQRVEWIDIHANPKALAPYGIDWTNAMQRIHLIDPHQRLQTGAYAFVALWSQLPYYHWLSVACRLPGLVPVMDFAYTHFARWRWKKRSADACEIR
jgi:predicted DCC family thiol-disulfide oxidoreductase YuxK